MYDLVQLVRNLVYGTFSSWGSTKGANKWAGLKETRTLLRIRIVKG